MFIITWRLDHSRRERCIVHTTFIFWPAVFSGGRIGESHLHGGVNSGVTDQRKQMPRPCHLSYRVCPCASSATFFTGQKLPFDLQQGTDVRRLTAKADSHIACRAHAVPLIHTCHVAPLSCSNSAVSFVKVRVVAENIRIASPTV